MTYMQPCSAMTRPQRSAAQCDGIRSVTKRLRSRGRHTAACNVCKGDGFIAATREASPDPRLIAPTDKRSARLAAPCIAFDSAAWTVARLARAFPWSTTRPALLAQQQPGDGLAELLEAA